MKTYKFKKIQESLKKIKEISEEKVLQEMCGLFGKCEDGYIVQECKNISRDPRNTFALDPLQFLMFKEKYQPIALFHSHIIGNEEPSDFDILMSENSCIPFIIYALNTKKMHIHTPEDSDVNFKLIKKTKEKINDYNNNAWNFS